MKHLNEWADYDKEEDESNYDLKNIFPGLNDSIDLKKYKPIEFLKSLNLTEDQYKKLATIIDEYGFERWCDGNTEGFYQGASYD